MSLFEDSRYQWRETYFVLFRRPKRPDAAATERLLERLKQQFDISDVRLDEHGRLESLTARDANSGSGMDLCYIAGSDVSEQIAEFLNDVGPGSSDVPEATRRELVQCEARYEVFHFETVDMLADDEDQFDPGALFEFLEEIEAFCQGIGIDPQSGTVI